MSRLKIIVCCAVLFISCSNKKTTSDILPPAKMQAVLWDVIRADAFTTYYIKKDSSKNAVEENTRLQKQIFAVHQVSKESFYDSYEYYKTKTNLFMVMLDSMINKANREKSKIPAAIKPLLSN